MDEQCVTEGLFDGVSDWVRDKLEMITTNELNCKSASFEQE